MTDAVQDIPYADLRPSPLNTRKTFNAEAIARLADSIFAQGIQQNLVARKVFDKAAATLDQYYYELVAGERRYRACGVLIERGERTAEMTLPVRVVHCDDTDLLQLNLIENLQRQDLHPLDEAEGYAALIAAGRSIANIADIVPFTKRHVELRLALANNLGGEAKEAFRAGDMTLAQARVMAAYAPPERQAAVVEMIAGEDEDYETADDLKHMLTQDMIPARLAFFDRALYDGPRVRDPEDPDSEYFADAALFAKLQNQAARDALAKLKKTYAWAEIETGHYFQSYNYQHSTDKKIAGAVVYVNKRTREVTVYTDLLKPKDARRVKKAAAKKTGKGKEAAAAPARPEAYLPARAGLKQAKIAKTNALRAAMIDTGRTPAMIAVAMALMNARRDIHLRREHGAPDDERIVSPAVLEVLNKYRPRFKGLTQSYGTADGEIRLDGGAKAEGKAFEILAAMPPAEIEELFTALVASTIGTYPGHRAELGDNPIAAGLARECSADVTGHWKIDADYLAACHKLPLRRIAASIGATYPSADDAATGRIPAEALEKMKAKDLRAAILGHLKREPDAAVFLPAPFHFGTQAELLAMAGPRAEPKAENAAKAAPKARAKPRARAKIKSPKKIKEARTRFAKKATAKAKAAVIEGFRP